MNHGKYILTFIVLVYSVLFLVTCNNSFFWDTTHLASLQAWWFYDNNFRYFFLPAEFDSGHPPFFSIVLAAAWKLFGTHLIVGHVIIFLTTILLIFEVAKLSDYFFSEKGYLACLLVLFNPIVMAQCTLVSPDVFLLCFFVFTLNGIFSQKKPRVLLGAIVLCAISMRGMMCAGVLFLFSIFRTKFSLQSIATWMLPFAPSFIVAIIFLLSHYLHTGWIGHHAGSPWAPSFERVGVGGFIRNIMVFGWRMIDMGMLLLWLFFGFFVIKSLFKGQNISRRTRELFLLSFCCLLLMVFPQFFYKHLLMHRYLMPFIMVLTFAVFSISEEYLSLVTLKKVTLFSVLGLLLGNLWVFPDHIAKGWDSTLAHLPYYGLRKDALTYLKENDISLNRVSGGFPYYESGKCLDLNNDTMKYSQAPPESAAYILYSNISNDYSDTQLLFLKEKCVPVKTFGKWPVRFVLYRNPEFNK